MFTFPWLQRQDMNFLALTNRNLLFSLFLAKLVCWSFRQRKTSERVAPITYIYYSARNLDGTICSQKIADSSHILPSYLLQQTSKSFFLRGTSLTKKIGNFGIQTVAWIYRKAYFVTAPWAPQLFKYLFVFLYGGNTTVWMYSSTLFPFRNEHVVVLRLPDDHILLGSDHWRLLAWYGLHIEIECEVSDELKQYI